MENEKKLSIIIVSYNTKQVTDDCLQSIYSADWRSEFEVIVVDNNSSDGSQEMIRIKYPQVNLIANNDNKLFAPANNQAAAVAKGKYLFLLNSDTLIWNDNVQRMLDYFESLPSDVVCIGPRILNPDKTLQSCGYPNSSLKERFMMCSKLYKYITPPHWLIFGLPKDATRQVGWVSGCAMMIPKSLYEGVGGLNETMGFYGEEPEFGYRTWNKYHLKTLYYHDAEIIHLGGVSSKKTNRTPDEVRLRRYAALQRETVGYNRSIWMSRIVLGFAYIKRAISSNKLCFTEAIEWEKKVIAYLKKQKKTKE